MGDAFLLADDAAHAVLGSLLVEPALLPEVADVISEADFADVRQAQVYRAIRDLWDSGEPVDKVSVFSRLTGDPNDNSRFLSQLVNTVPTVASIRHYASLVRSAADRRSAVDFAKRLAQQASEGDAVENLVAMCQAWADQIRNKACARQAVPIVEALETQGYHYAVSDRPGMPFGWPDLDSIASEMREGELHVIAGRPGMGKSAFCERVATHVAKHHPVLLIPAEMGRVKTIDRLLAREFGLSYREFRHLPVERKREMASGSRLRDLMLTIGDNVSTNTLESITADIARVGPRLVVIDHARHIHPWTESRRGEARDQGPTRLLYGLIRVAARYECAILLASQLNRMPASSDRMRSIKPVDMADLRDTGAFEELATQVIMLHRDTPKTVRIFVEKNRHGEPGEIRCVWFGRTMEFGPMADEETA